MSANPLMNFHEHKPDYRACIDQFNLPDCGLPENVDFWERSLRITKEIQLNRKSARFHRFRATQKKRLNAILKSVRHHQSQSATLPVARTVFSGTAPRSAFNRNPLRGRWVDQFIRKICDQITDSYIPYEDYLSFLGVPEKDRKILLFIWGILLGCGLERAVEWERVEVQYVLVQLRYIIIPLFAHLPDEFSTYGSPSEIIETYDRICLQYDLLIWQHRPADLGETLMDDDEDDDEDEA